MARLKLVRSTRAYLRDLSVILGQLSAIQTRCLVLAEEAGELPVDFIGPQGQNKLGEHLWHVMFRVCAIQQLLYETTNAMRKSEGMKAVSPSEAYTRSRELFTLSLEEVAKQLKAP